MEAPDPPGATGTENGSVIHVRYDWSVTGRRAVGNLLRHFDRMARRDPVSLSRRSAEAFRLSSQRRTHRLGGYAEFSGCRPRTEEFGGGAGHVAAQPT